MKVGQTDRRSSLEKSKNPKETCWTIDIDELKKLLMVDTIKSYSNFNLFKTKVLEVAQKEINSLTDITFYVEPITKGRKTIKVKFTIVSKNMIERMYTNTKNDELLGELE